MNSYPIRVERTDPYSKFIEWALHNVCTYDCSFCGADNKDGSIRWKSLEEYKICVDKLMTACKEESVYIMLTGGEPTLFPKLINLYQYIHQHKNVVLGLTSNGTRSIRWWKEFRDSRSVDRLFLTFHSAQTKDYQKIIDIAALFHDEPVEVYIMVTHELTSIELAFEGFYAIKKQTGAWVNLNSMQTPDNRDSQYDPVLLKKYIDISWTKGDLSSTKKLPTLPISVRQQVKTTFSDGSISIDSADVLVRQKKYVFTDWNCYIGEHTMRIMGDSIWRGICREGGPVQKFSDPAINFQTDPITCKKAKCSCPADYIQLKIRPENLGLHNKVIPIHLS